MLKILILTTPILTISLTIPFDSPIMKKKKNPFFVQFFFFDIHTLHDFAYSYDRHSLVKPLFIFQIQSIFFFFSDLLGFPTASATTVF